MATSSYILSPVESKGRIASLDILRGVAVLGILIMNIQSFAMPSSAYLNPTSFERLGGNDLIVWLGSHVFADQKFMTIFSMLFGASLIMLSQKAQKEQLRSTDLQHKRFFYLGIIGLVHAYLIWAGDILFSYAVCGFLVFNFRNRRSTLQIRAGIIFLLIGSAISLTIGYTVPLWEAGEYEATKADIWLPTSETIARQIEYYTSSWERQMLVRVPEAFGMQTNIFVFESFWRVSGCMLIGMALYKRRVFKLKQSSKYYMKMVAYGFGLGLPLVAVGTLLDFNYDWDFRLSFFYFSQFNYWGSVLMALGYIGLIMLLCKRSTSSFLAKKMADVGRMALSNYLIQSIICSFIFYGHGLALFGDLDRSAQAVLVLGIWTFQIFFSALWLNFFKFGPFEWIWRSLTYGKTQPLFNT